MSECWGHKGLQLVSTLPGAQVLRPQKLSVVSAPQ